MVFYEKGLHLKIDERKENIERLRKKHKRLLIIQILLGLWPIINLFLWSYLIMLPIILILQKYKLFYFSKIENFEAEILKLNQELEDIQKTRIEIERNALNLVKEDKKHTEIPQTEVELISQSDLYLKLFGNVKQYNFKKELTPEFLKIIKRVKDVDYERFMNVSNTRERPTTFVVFDLETTGLNNKTSEIIEIGAIRFIDNVPKEMFHTYIRPKNEITEEITSINGITNEMVSEAPAIEEILPFFLDFIQEDILVAHNAGFDMSFILQNLYDNGYRKLKNKVIDTLALSRQKVRELDYETDRPVKLTSYRLDMLKYDFGFYNLDSHNAIDDCKVCAYVYQRIVAANDDVCYTGIDYVEVSKEMLEVISGK